jgi:hypothetical protein
MLTLQFPLLLRHSALMLSPQVLSQRPTPQQTCCTPSLTQQQTCRWVPGKLMLNADIGSELTPVSDSVHPMCRFAVLCIPLARLTGCAVLCLAVAAAVLQLFWEAFPAEGGRSRTTYMFAYSGEHCSWSSASPVQLLALHRCTL